MLQKIFFDIIIFIQYFLLFFFLYWFSIGLFGFGKPKKKASFNPKSKFLILIPAHNESKVIANLVQNLNNMDYPRKLYDIYVIADNCTDNTAEISKNNKAKVIVHTSKEGELKGKPYAISYALQELKDYEKIYDGVCIFDVDNLVTLNYLKEMNNALLRGEKLIQCYLDTKNPTDNWISLSYATSYYYMNRSWQLSKENLGLGNAIGGTGFCVKSDVLKEVGWTARSLTEDLEFQIQCVLKDVPATWCHQARVFDEKPLDFKASCTQRLRWARGHWDVCSNYTGKLLIKTIKDLDVIAFDSMMYLINPGKITLNTLMVVLSSVGYIFKDSHFSSYFKYLLPWWVWVILMAFQLIYITYCILIDTDKPFKKLLGIIYLPIFNYTYFPLFVAALFTKNNKSWNPTTHNRTIQFTEKLNKKD